jgi:hypothetical protein
MSNRLAELETVLSRDHKKKASAYKQLKPGIRARAPQGALMRVKTKPGPTLPAPGSVISKSLSGLVSRWPSRAASIGRAFGAIDFSIPGVFGPLAQPSVNSCWATVFTMLMSWRRQQSLSIEEALATVGRQWVDLYKADTGLGGSQKSAFLTAAGLVAEPPQSYSIEGWEQLLRNYGPVWVTTDEAPGKAWAIHARVITAIRGDGTPEKTSFTIVDPAGGKQYQESIASFIPKYEEEVINAGYMRIQVVHWLADARAEVKAQSADRSMAGASRRAKGMAAPAIVPIVSVIVGAVMTRLLENEGDVKWELDQLAGLQHVGDDPATAGPAPYQDKTIRINGPVCSTTRFNDRIWADTEIEYVYNGHSLGDVTMKNVSSSDAVWAGLVQRALIQKDPNNRVGYTRAPSTERFAAIKIEITYQFNYTWFDNDVYVDEIKLYGDGKHDFKRRQTQ